MIHPSTALRFIDEHKGYGVFATEFIPKGTITYVKDPLEIEVSSSHFKTLSPEMQFHVDKYSYVDERGMYILSWDLGKYVNHCCNCNTMSTGYGFEIAIIDIAPGEEITDEYGLFNLTESMNVQCEKGQCRGCLNPQDIDVYFNEWDQKVKPAIAALPLVSQPLFSLVDKATKRRLAAYKKNKNSYRSVHHLKFVPLGRNLSPNGIKKLA